MSCVQSQILIEWYLHWDFMIYIKEVRAILVSNTILAYIWQNLQKAEINRQTTCYFCYNLFSGADPGGPPLTLGFEAPKFSIFGPYLIFP